MMMMLLCQLSLASVARSIHKNMSSSETSFLPFPPSDLCDVLIGNESMFSRETIYPAASTHFLSPSLCLAQSHYPSPTLYPQPNSPPLGETADKIPPLPFPSSFLPLCSPFPPPFPFSVSKGGREGEGVHWICSFL